MFGKKSMSSSSKFIMARGKSVGNLKGSPPMKKDKVTKVAAVKRVDKGREHLGKYGDAD